MCLRLLPQEDLFRFFPFSTLTWFVVSTPQLSTLHGRLKLSITIFSRDHSHQSFTLDRYDEDQTLVFYYYFCWYITTPHPPPFYPQPCPFEMVLQ